VREILGPSICPAGHAFGLPAEAERLTTDNIFPLRRYPGDQWGEDKEQGDTEKMPSVGGFCHRSEIVRAACQENAAS
jgi:hypothetical protein